MVFPSCNQMLSPATPHSIPEETPHSIAVSVLLSGFPPHRKQTGQSAPSALKATAAPYYTSSGATSAVVASPRPPLAQKVTTAAIAQAFTPQDLQSSIDRRQGHSREEISLGVSGRDDTQGVPPAKRPCTSPGLPVASAWFPPTAIFSPPSRASPPDLEVPKKNGRHYPILPPKLWKINESTGIATCQACRTRVLNVLDVTDRHQTRHHLGIEGCEFICGYFDGIHCQSRFSSPEERSGHWLQAHRFEALPGVECPVTTCRRTVCRTELPEHAATEHQCVKFYCGSWRCSSVSSFSSLNRHMEKQHGTPPQERGVELFKEALFDSDTGLLKQTPLP